MNLASELGIAVPIQEPTISLGSQKSFQVSSPVSLGSQKSFQLPSPVVQAKKEVVAFFGVGVECVGEIWYEGNVQIDGRMEGTVHTKGTLVIGDRAVVKAKIEAGSVICKGKIQGDVVAKDSIKLLSPGFIDGTMSAPRLSVESGGVFNGRVSMGASS
ncbi:MAG: polymer-forming cytoskeletal protein [Nitrospirales bacterium]|nr:MAG: polymer-forming cytoskeletal protein [Nitrospirales bacterium]